jgi:hypothetical protein
MTVRYIVRDLIKRLKNWWRKHLRLRQFRGVAFLAPDADPSSALKTRVLVLVGSLEKPKWLRFICPCRCGEVIALNLMGSYYPRWEIILHSNGTLSVTPSVDSKKCNSHFWIRRNQIEWV